MPLLIISQGIQERKLPWQCAAGMLSRRRAHNLWRLSFTFPDPLTLGQTHHTWDSSSLAFAGQLGKFSQDWGGWSVMISTVSFWTMGGEKICDRGVHPSHTTQFRDSSPDPLDEGNPGAISCCPFCSCRISSPDGRLHPLVPEAGHHKIKIMKVFKLSIPWL